MTREIIVTTTVKQSDGLNRVIERREFTRLRFGSDAYAAACSYARDVMAKFPDRTSTVYDDTWAQESQS
jgi:hypothetical protein